MIFKVNKHREAGRRIHHFFPLFRPLARILLRSEYERFYPRSLLYRIFTLLMSGFLLFAVVLMGLRWLGYFQNK
jgi:hypothetical protein